VCKIIAPGAAAVEDAEAAKPAATPFPALFAFLKVNRVQYSHSRTSAGAEFAPLGVLILLFARYFQGMQKLVCKMQSYFPRLSIFSTGQ
jgi:hypothetical protein